MSIEIEASFAVKILTAFIREELAKFGFKKGILGLSGGLDSTLCATLAAKALGPGNVTGLIMPYGKSFSRDTEDARDVARRLKIKSAVVDIGPMVDAYFRSFPAENRVQRGNMMARQRMAVLYDHSVREKALILGTSNKTELLIGYGTIHGDMACAVNPLGDLYKTQVRQLAVHLKAPRAVLAKQPTAGLWPGQTDEGEIGMSYAELDAILYSLVDERKSVRDLVAAGFKKSKVLRILSLIKASEFKRQMPPIAKISARSIGHDFLYPYDWDK